MVASRNFSQRLCAHCAKQMDWIKKGKKAEEIITPLLTVLSRVSFKIAQELCKINKLFPMYWNPLSCYTGTGDLHREEWLQIRFARGWGWSLSLQVQILLNAHYQYAPKCSGWNLSTTKSLHSWSLSSPSEQGLFSIKFELVSFCFFGIFINFFTHSRKRWEIREHYCYLIEIQC